MEVARVIVWLDVGSLSGLVLIGFQGRVDCWRIVEVRVFSLFMGGVSIMGSIGMVGR